MKKTKQIFKVALLVTGGSFYIEISNAVIPELGCLFSDELFKQAIYTTIKNFNNEVCLNITGEKNLSILAQELVNTRVNKTNSKQFFTDFLWEYNFKNYSEFGNVFKNKKSLYMNLFPPEETKEFCYEINQIKQSHTGIYAINSYIIEKSYWDYFKNQKNSKKLKYNIYSYLESALHKYIYSILTLMPPEKKLTISYDQMFLAYPISEGNASTSKDYTFQKQDIKELLDLIKQYKKSKKTYKELYTQSIKSFLPFFNIEAAYFDLFEKNKMRLSEKSEMHQIKEFIAFIENKYDENFLDSDSFTNIKLPVHKYLLLGYLIYRIGYYYTAANILFGAIPEKERIIKEINTNVQKKKSENVRLINDIKNAEDEALKYQKELIELEEKENLKKKEKKVSLIKKQANKSEKIEKVQPIEDKKVKTLPQRPPEFFIDDNSEDFITVGKKKNTPQKEEKTEKEIIQKTPQLEPHKKVILDTTHVQKVIAKLLVQSLLKTKKRSQLSLKRLP
jgi:hypothetical protein